MYCNCCTSIESIFLEIVFTDYSTLKQTSCIEGIVSYEFETGDVLYDNTKETSCEFGQTKCYKATMTATVGNYPSKSNESKSDVLNIYFAVKEDHI